MKVLLINSVVGYGSTGTITLDLYQKIISKGDKALVAFGRMQGVDDINSINITSTATTLSHVLLTRLFDRHGFGSKSDTKKLIDQIQQFNPDIIHLHNIHGYYVNIAMLFSALKKIDAKVVWTLHDCWSITGHCTHFIGIGCDKWQTQCNNCPQKKIYPASFLFDSSAINHRAKKQIFTSIDNMTIVCPSVWLTNIIGQSYLSKYPIKTIPNGIDLSILKPMHSDIRKTLGIVDKKVILGIASPFTSKKGFDDFIKLSEIIPNEYCIVMVGLNQKQIKNLPGNIIGIERISDKQEIVKLYSMADVFFNPTKEDTLPTTIMESIACETPVVTYDVGGCSELLDHRCGAIVPKEDLILAFQEIRNLCDQQHSLKNYCRQRAELFDKDQHLETIYQLYRQVLND